MRRFKIFAIVVLFISMAFAFKIFDLDKDFFAPKNGFSLPQPEYEVLDGNRYTPINIAEMIILLDRGDMDNSDERYVARGMIYRNEEFDSKGQMGFVRVVITCCIADAVPFGIKVAYSDFESLEEGEWVKIYGTFKKTVLGNENKGNNESPDIKPDDFNIVDHYVFVPDKIEKIELPADPYITDWKEKAPFVY